MKKDYSDKLKDFKTKYQTKMTEVSRDNELLSNQNSDLKVQLEEARYISKVADNLCSEYKNKVEELNVKIQSLSKEKDEVSRELIKLRMVFLFIFTIPLVS